MKLEILKNVGAFAFLAVSVWIAVLQTRAPINSDLQVQGYEVSGVLNDIVGTRINKSTIISLDTSDIYNMSERVGRRPHLIVLLSGAACAQSQVSQLRDIARTLNRSSDSDRRITILFHSRSGDSSSRKHLAIMKKASRYPFELYYTSDSTYFADFPLDSYPVYLSVDKGMVTSARSKPTNAQFFLRYATAVEQ